VSATEPHPWLAGALVPGRFGAAAGEPVRLGTRACELVQVLARRDGDAALQAAIRAAGGPDLPPPGHAAQGERMAALWTQPRGWLIQAGPDAGLARRLADACGPAAAVVEQTHGRCVFTLEGAHARAVLARLCRVDLHPRAFGPGRVAVTPLSEIAAVIHQTGAAPGFDIIVASSYARAVAGMLAAAAAPIGYQVGGDQMGGDQMGGDQMGGDRVD